MIIFSVGADISAAYRLSAAWTLIPGEPDHMGAYCEMNCAYWNE